MDWRRWDFRDSDSVLNDRKGTRGELLSPTLMSFWCSCLTIQDINGYRKDKRRPFALCTVLLVGAAHVYGSCGERIEAVGVKGWRTAGQK